MQTSRIIIPTCRPRCGSSGCCVGRRRPRFSCRKFSSTVWVTVASSQPGGADVGQRRRGCLLDGGAGLQPGLRPGEPGAQRVDGGGAGLYAGAPGVLVAGGLDRGVDPANAVPLGRGQRG
jgi:hypothetical protein